MKKAAETGPKGLWTLLKTKRFSPFFWTQFFGALNDNFFKTAFAILITYSSFSNNAIKSHLWVNLSAGLFIAPFFLFSAMAGQLADKMEKAHLIRRIKAAEVAIMAIAFPALYFNWLHLLLVLLFAMGAQSAFFGPVKYSLLPQHLKVDELVGGNAVVEMGTFMAILAGTILGGSMLSIESGRFWVGILLLGIAVVGWLSSRRIPLASASDPALKINFNIFGQTRQIIAFARKDNNVFRAILAISWFWFLGSAYLTQLPSFARDVLYCRPEVISLLLALFAIGIAAGSLVCARLSGSRVELGLVVLGILGMTVFGWDLAWAANLAPPDAMYSLSQFIKLPGALRVLADLALIGFCGGLYIVPLFAYVQLQTPEKVRSRIIAAGNIANALFMVASAVFAALFLTILRMPLLQFFLLLSLLNLLVGIVMCRKAPFLAFRAIALLFIRTLYRIRYENLSRIPAKGPAVLVCNHVSYIDALIIYTATCRPVRFAMHVKFYKIPLIGRLLKVAGGIPIDSGRKNPAILNRAFQEITTTLKNGGLICIFPEGKLTRNGQIDAFRPGVERIVARTQAPVIPMALRGLWGSFFSHKNGAPMKQLPKRFWSKIELSVGSHIAPNNVTTTHLHAVVQQLKGSWA